MENNISTLYDFFLNVFNFHFACALRRMIGAGIRYVVKKDVLVIVIPWVVRLYVEIIHEL